MSQTRRLAAVLAHVAGYSQLLVTDEEGTLERLERWPTPGVFVSNVRALRFLMNSGILCS
jgi:hypothetical protein